MACGVLPSTFVEVGEYSGRSTPSTVPTPVSFGVVIKQGDVVGSNLIPAWDGVNQQAQVDVLSVWPDGSLKHARVSFLAPGVGANSIRDVTITAGSPTQPGSFDISRVSDDDLYNYLEILRSDGTSFKATMDRSVASALLTDAKNQDLSAPPPAGYKRLAFGKVMCEYEAFVPLLDPAGVAHPWLKALLRVRIWSQWAGAFVDWAIENAPVPLTQSEPWVRDTNFGPVTFTHIRLVTGSTSQYERYKFDGFPAVTLGCKILTDARCRISGWTKDNTGAGHGGEPPKLYTLQDFVYVSDNLMLPKLDYNNPLTTSNLSVAGVPSQYATRWCKTTGGSYVVAEGCSGVSGGTRQYQDYTIHPNGVPFLVDPYQNSLAQAGAAAHIGVVPNWDAALINSRGATNRGLIWKLCYAASSNGCATFGSTGLFQYHAREPVTSAPALEACADAWKNSAWDGIAALSSDNYTVANEFGHSPHAAYVMWMATCEYYFADELSFWAAHGPQYNDFGNFLPNNSKGKKPLIFSVNRYGGWPFRNLCSAAFLLPDGYYSAVAQHCSGTASSSRTIDDVKAYHFNIIVNTLEYWKEYRDEVVYPLHTTPDPTCSSWNTDRGKCAYDSNAAAARDENPLGSQYNGWQRSFFIWPLFWGWGLFRSDSRVSDQLEKNYDWFNQVHFFLYCDPRVHPEYHQRSGFATSYNSSSGVWEDVEITYNKIEWVFDAPDTVTSIDWGAVGTTGYDRRYQWLETYSLTIAVALEITAKGNGCPQVNTSKKARALKNLGEVCWYTTISTDMSYDSGPPDNLGCPLIPVAGKNICRQPQVDWDGDGNIFPAVAESFRVCEWVSDDASGANWSDRVLTDNGQGNGAYWFGRQVLPVAVTYFTMKGDSVGLAAATEAYLFMKPRIESQRANINKEYPGFILIP